MRRRFNNIVLFLMVAVLTVIGFSGMFRSAKAEAERLPFASGGAEFALRGKFYTSYGGSTEERKHNIALAAAAIDGTLIEPGGQFSFNFVVGERTAARGYLPAKIISTVNLRTESAEACARFLPLSTMPRCSPA